MVLGAEWCSLAEVKALLGEPLPADAAITAAIQLATSFMVGEFCVTPVDLDPEDTYPDDWRVRQACAILASQVLVATPITAGPGEENIESETIGGYTYRMRASRSAATALRMDGRVFELVGGYLCDGGAATGVGVYELETHIRRAETS